MRFEEAFSPVSGGGRGGWMVTPVETALNRINSLKRLTFEQERS